MIKSIQFKSIKVMFITLLLLNVTTVVSAQTDTHLSDKEVKNIVQRSYQYVAMYNVIQKFALNPNSGGMYLGGYNTPSASTTLMDHTNKSIARPNNDTFYQGAALDLRNEPVIISFPMIDSKYVSLQISGYDHYVDVPLATSRSDFKKATKVLFYTDRTQGYHGESIKGINRILKVDGDFTLAFLRAMPHQSDPKRMAKIIQALKDVTVLTLSEFHGKKPKKSRDVNFPAYAKTDADLFSNNLLEVMQFIFNHTSFDVNDKMDKALLSAYKPLGVVPGKVFNQKNIAKIDGKKFAKTAMQVANEVLANQNNLELQRQVLHQIFLPKGKIDLQTQVNQSVIGPIGLPGHQARYIPIATKSGKPMNAQYDYVMHMSKDNLPPAKAFWSLTLYDLKNGFFVPNEHKKYSVGENAGYKLNSEGGIDIYVTAKKPQGVPAENWLPINRENLGINGMFRIYVPDAQKIKTWKIPQFEALSMGLN